jgi:hypothetical protein
MESRKKTKNARVKKWGMIILGILVAALILFIYVKFYFVWGEGVKSGQLNYVVYKGYVFKTYEGKLIQAGIKSNHPNGSVQSNEFIFSVSNKKVAEKLMLIGGHDVDLHYKEYLGIVPWRGYSKYVVDSIVIKSEEELFPIR